MYGLIGKKLSHSFSADFFNEKFALEGIAEEYKLMPINSIKDFPSVLENNPQLNGLNVTIPYKETVIPYLDALSEEAKLIGAVNVIKVERKGNISKLKGYNTDCIGFENSLKPLLKGNKLQALILGTGGASKAVKYVLNKLDIPFKVVSRKKSPGVLTYNEIDSKIIEENHLIVNTTPLGMFPKIEDFPQIPYEAITPDHICYDLIYNPEETEFLKKCKAKNAVVKNGFEMLKLQALAAWDIWTK